MFHKICICISVYSVLEHVSWQLLSSVTGPSLCPPMPRHDKIVVNSTTSPCLVGG